MPPEDPTEALIELQAKTLTEDGRGVGHHQGWEIRVADLLPGERARVRVEHRSPHRKRAWAHIVDRLGDASPERVQAPCAAYEACAGCVWQHLDYPAQLPHKRDIVDRALREAGVDAGELHLPLASPRSFAYRNTGKYVVTRAPDGALLLGAFAERSHRVVDTLPCLVVEDPIARLARRLHARIEEIGLPVADATQEGLRYLIIRCNDEKQLLVGLVCHSSLDDAGPVELAEALMHETGVVGVLRCNNDATNTSLLSDDIHLLAGAPSISEKVGGTEVQIGLRSFWQLNREQALRAYEDIASLLELPDGSRLIELYCGVGGISLALSAHRELSSHGIDSNDEAISAARTAAKASPSCHASFERGDARALEASELASYDAVVVDPPRKGLGTALCTQLAESGAPAIAYLSCGPESLGRDLAQLLAAGYELAALRLYDFMPHTSQVETLAILRRAPASRG